MQVGLVGVPNSGKSSFFKALTMIDVPIANFPFTTINPNIGVGYATIDCVCKEFKVKCNPQNSRCVDGKRHIPVKIIDVAGLVKGAHEGRGMGNKFLDDLRQAFCLIQVLDVSGKTDAEGKAAENFDPSESIKVLIEEIDFWFTNIVKRGLEKFKKKSQFSRVEISEILFQQLTGLGVTKEQIIRALDATGVEDIERFARELRKLSKQIIIAANKIDIRGAEKNLEKVKKEFPGLTIIPTSAAAEIALRTADQKGLIEYNNNSFKIKDKSKLNEKQMNGLDFIRENVLDKYGSTGVQECLNRSIFDVLKYIVVYPVADANKLTDSRKNVLPDAFLVPKGLTLKEFAAKVHTDLAEHFIGGIDARTKRKLSADYELKNNDVVEILFQKR